VDAVEVQVEVETAVNVGDELVVMLHPRNVKVYRQNE